jgi:hypothetical protein
MLQRFLNLVRPAPKRFSFRAYKRTIALERSVSTIVLTMVWIFCELLQFDQPLPTRASPLRAEFEAALDALNVTYGIRYYQGFTPREIVFDCFQPTTAQRAFFQDLYVNGLGEFGYR